MFENLEAYLEEISHFLADRQEREEILSEIKSHVLEKAEQEFGRVSEATVQKAIAAYGPARVVAEKYLDGRPIIAPAFRRHLFRYTALLFAVHLVLIFFAAIFKKSFTIFPFVFMPRLAAIDAVMYLPTAFLTDLGAVFLVLYLITQSGRDIKLPWPRFGIDLDEVQPPRPRSLLGSIPRLIGAVLMLIATTAAVALFIKFKTIFFASLNFSAFKPLLTADAGQRISLIAITMLAAGTAGLIAKLFSSSRWINVFDDSAFLILLGLLLRQPLSGFFALDLPETLLPKIGFGLALALLIIAFLVAIDLVRNLALIGRRRLPK